MRATRGLEDAGDRRIRRPGERTGHHAEEDVEKRIQPGEVDAEPVGDEQADEVLAVAADVEHPAAEREGHGEAGQDERRRLQQRLRDVVRGDDCPSTETSVRRMEEPVQSRAVEDLLEDDERLVRTAVLCRGDDDPLTTKAKSTVIDRHDDPTGALLQREARREAGWRLLRRLCRLGSRRRLLLAAEHLEADLLLRDVAGVLADDLRPRR